MPSMGSKRGRFLMRQHRLLKKDSEIASYGESEETEVVVKLERQSSEPTPSLLTVPQSHQLTKQNSSPGIMTSVTYPEPPVVQPQPQPQPQPQSQLQLQAHPVSQLAGPAPPRIKVSMEDYRWVSATQSFQCSKEPCEAARACHCPALRPGPALGCNFCWNTIDGHGRILRRKTKYHCPECQTNLCIVPCFQEYHERQNACGSGTSKSRDTTDSAPHQGPSSSIMKTSSL